MKFRQSAVIAGLAAFILFPLSAEAGIKNKGDDAVSLEVERDSGFTQQVSLYPGQTIDIPEGATAIRIVPRSLSTRGDESIEVVITEPNGNSSTLKEPGQSYKLGTPPDSTAEPAALKPGKVTNKGNINVDIVITHASGLTDERQIYVGQPVDLSEDVTQVQVLANRRLRGDEIVRVSVNMPDGEVVQITSLGGIAKLKQNGS
ncbi:MAG TPA: hypothetical protein VL688_07420 [Verrucomicrobiae bacterium]|nr:hypothetical protein [Verrucomicrobiae bacterium]